MESEGFAHHFIDIAGVILISIDADQKITLINRRACEVFGYTAQEAIGKNFVDLLVPEEMRELAKAEISHTINGEKFLQEYRETEIQAKNGSRLMIAWYNSYIRDGEGNVKGLLISGINITKRLEAETSLRENRRQLSTLLSNLPGLAYRCKNDRNWTMEFISDGCLELTGYRPEALIGNTKLSYADIIVEEDAEYIWSVIQQALDDSLPFQIEYRIHTADGRIKWVWEQGRGVYSEKNELLALEGFISDVTDRMEAREALRQSESRFRAIFEAAEDGIFLKDTKCRYTAANPAMARLFSCSMETFLGRQDKEIFADRIWGIAEDSDQRVIKGEIVHEECFITNGTSKYTCDIVKVPLRNGDNSVIGICGIARDITEMKRLQELSGRAERLETAGKIAGQVAHDFNNLLGPLMAYPEIMKDELPADHPILQYIEDIEKSAQQIADINTQLLTLGRRGHYNQEVVNLNVLIEQAILQHHDNLGHIELELELQKDLLNVIGGASQLLRVVSNLLANAIDAVGGDGVIRITTENHYADISKNAYEGVPKGEYIKVIIKDNGIGIKPEIIDRIYDPFFTTKTASRTRGSGLGLSVVHSVVKDHGGYVNLKSEPGRGSSFTIYLPATREGITTEGKGEVIPGGVEKILVVDDDKTQRDVTLKLLERLGYDAWAIESGEQALELMQNNTFDLLILDMIMPPGMNGVETYRATLELNPDQKAIVISGYAESRLIEEIQSLGAGEFIRKPLKLKSLARAIREELDRKKVS
ncbi:MAG: PAS domain S-box protein [Candidatus Zixiibacteriota bacterium]